MPIPWLFVAATTVASQTPPAAPRDPRSQALTIKDALYQIPEVTGRIVPVGDADGDGIGDLVIERGKKHYQSDRIDLVSTKTGALIRTLWRRTESQVIPPAWDAAGGGEDGVDLYLGFPDADGGAGRVLAVSGKTGEAKYQIKGAPGDRLGSSIVAVRDVAGVASAKLCIGAVQYDPKKQLIDRPIASESQTFKGNKVSSYITFQDGTTVERGAYMLERLQARSTLPGYVTLRNARDGSELWRADGSVSGLGLGSHVSCAGDVDADHEVDVLAQCDLNAALPILVLSGATGKELSRLDHLHGWAGCVGDLDGDGVPDLFLDQQDENLVGRSGRVRMVSGKTHKTLFELPYPDAWDEYEATVPLGDVDGDGVADVALGAPNFNLLASGNPGYVPGNDPDLEHMSLSDALKLESEPWCAFTWESGCAIVYSGRTHEAIFGVWAAPGTRRGLGLAVARVPDVDGDGFPDLIVSDQDIAYVFAGPGPEKK